jgi:glutaminase
VSLLKGGYVLKEIDKEKTVNALFGSRSEFGVIRKEDLKRELLNAGILSDDPRIKLFHCALDSLADDIDEESFVSLLTYAPHLLEQIFFGNLVVPDFQNFTDQVTRIFRKTESNKDGEVASYIPQLARVEPDKFAVAICTVDGQRFSIGDCDDFFCVQSCSKPLSYLLALEELEGRVHEFVGREPSGRSFNEIALNSRGLPHNPMINAGAIMCCSLIKQGWQPADRFDYVLERWRAAAAGMRVGFNNSVYLSERQTADRNFALGYLMKEKRAFPAKCNLLETLEFYFQCCSIELNAKSLATVASTLAFGGTCPLTGQQVFKSEYVKNCLSLMASCGMYDFSGEFAFSVGLPAKSGVAGAVMVVIPNVMGICVWSPRLDELGNSVRGVEFCKRLVDNFKLHIFDTVPSLSLSKIDPKTSYFEQDSSWKISFIWAAAVGDVAQMRRLIARGANLDAADYDGRTALHVASSEGNEAAVQFLLNKGAAVNPIDRWQNTPTDDAFRQNRKDIKAILLEAGGKLFSEIGENEHD